MQQQPSLGGMFLKAALVIGCLQSSTSETVVETPSHDPDTRHKTAATLEPAFDHAKAAREIERDNSETALKIRMCTEAIKEDPKNLDAYLGRGKCYFYHGVDGTYHKHAAADFQKCTELNPDHMYALHLLSMASDDPATRERSRKKHFDLELQQWNEDLGKDPRSTHALSNRAFTYLHHGYKDEALKDAQHCLEIDPKHENARQIVDEILSERED